MMKPAINEIHRQLCANAFVVDVVSSLLKLMRSRLLRDPDFSLEVLAKQAGIDLKRLNSIFLNGKHSELTLNDISDIALCFDCEIQFSVSTKDYF